MLRAALLVLCAGLVRTRSLKEGPEVDSGVFVITHIKSCRLGSGYCVLGSDCTVDSDFIKDDSGGNCINLGHSFNPNATFVCCMVDPVSFSASYPDPDTLAVIVDNSVSPSTTTTTTSTTTTSTPQTSTYVVTDVVTELYTQTEIYTKVETSTEVFAFTEISNSTQDSDEKVSTQEPDSINLG